LIDRKCNILNLTKIIQW